MTYFAEKRNLALNRPEVFDPALKHFPSGFRAGEPQFQTEAETQQWYHMREHVLHFILGSVRDSLHAAHLILRGSITLGSWLGDRARRPGDIDWVVIPEGWRIESQESGELVTGIVNLLRGSRIHNALQISDQPFATEEIWTYEKAPGCRIIVPWKADNSTFDGTVQMDFVFSEPMPSVPVHTQVRIGDLPPIEMMTASREQSLAWKLLWLATDSYPMGKDLYDAVLLAESSQLELSLLRETFESAETPLNAPWMQFSRKGLHQWYADWEEFVKEYPHLTGTEYEWKTRLVNALDPIWTELERRE